MQVCVNGACMPSGVAHTDSIGHSNSAAGVDSADETRVIGHEAVQHRKRRHVDSLNVRTTVGASTCQDVQRRVAIGDANRYANAAREGRAVGEEAGQESAVGDLGAVCLALAELGAVDGLDM